MSALSLVKEWFYKVWDKRSQKFNYVPQAQWNAVERHRRNGEWLFPEYERADGFIYEKSEVGFTQVAINIF